MSLTTEISETNNMIDMTQKTQKLVSNLDWTPCERIGMTTQFTCGICCNEQTINV